MVQLIKLHEKRDNKEILINPINITYIKTIEYNPKANLGTRILFNAIGYNNNPQSLEVVESLEEILSLIKRS